MKQIKTLLTLATRNKSRVFPVLDRSILVLGNRLYLTSETQEDTISLPKPSGWEIPAGVYMAKSLMLLLNSEAKFVKYTTIDSAEYATVERPSIHAVQYATFMVATHQVNIELVTSVAERYPLVLLGEADKLCTYELGPLKSYKNYRGANDSRQMLNGYGITASGHINATNAHHLISTGIQMASHEDIIDHIYNKFLSEALEAFNVSATATLYAVMGGQLLAINDLEHFGVEIVSTPHDGKYPDVTRVIPTNAVHMFSVESKELKTALRSISDTSKHGVLTISYDEGNLRLETTGGVIEISAISAATPVSQSPQRLEPIALNYKYVVDLCGVIPGRIEFSFHPEQPTTKSVLCHDTARTVTVVIMPLRS